MRLPGRAVAVGAVGTFLVSWAFSACLSPTLPLPPPGQPDVAVLSSDGKSVRIKGGGAIHGASVTALNEEPSVLGAGVATADMQGAYDIRLVPVDLSVHPTNFVRIYQSFGADISEEIHVYVPFGVAFGAPPVGDAGTPNSSEAAGPADAGASDSAE